MTLIMCGQGRTACKPPMRLQAFFRLTCDHGMLAVAYVNVQRSSRSAGLLSLEGMLSSTLLIVTCDLCVCLSHDHRCTCELQGNTV